MPQRSATGFDVEQRRDLVEGLRARYPNLLATVRAHMENVDLSEAYAGACEVERYVVIADVLDYVLGGVEHGESTVNLLPSESGTRVRWAARESVPVSDVLSCYHACQVKLAELLMEEIERGEVVPQRTALQLILEVHTLNGRFTTQITEEYGQEAARAACSPRMGIARRAEQLLLGASFDTSGLGYELERHWHVGAVAVGPGAGEIAKTVARVTGCELLALPYPGDRVHVWWGRSRALEARELSGAIEAACSPGVMFSLGEPAAGVDGWRVTHRQAAAASRVALRRGEAVTTFADVGILAPWMIDPSLARSFVEIHLAFLADLKDEGRVARETLIEYFRAGHHAAAAASALRVDRGTLRRRLAAMESRLGCMLSARQAEIEVALRLETLLEARGEPSTATAVRDTEFHRFAVA